MADNSSPRTYASSIAIAPAPCPRLGIVGWAESPSSPTAPSVHPLERGSLSKRSRLFTTSDFVASNDGGQSWQQHSKIWNEKETYKNHGLLDSTPQNLVEDDLASVRRQNDLLQQDMVRMPTNVAILLSLEPTTDNTQKLHLLTEKHNWLAKLFITTCVTRCPPFQLSTPYYLKIM